MGAEEQNKLMYIVMCVFEYAHQQGISVADAMHFLLDNGGVKFLNTHYDIEHTLPLEDTMDALTAVCRRSTQDMATA